MVDEETVGTAASATPNDSTLLVPSQGGGAVELPEPGYELTGTIGRGGMGEVLAARDRRMDREVAVKRMRSASPSDEGVTRFLREARIQARLDHPAIVPVHELGTDESGQLYFTMKRLVAKTLAERLAAGASQPQLLRAFVDVCHAVQYAHERGVVHRDLKPSNIMLGDYGEVYVIDWGIAHVATGRRGPTSPGAPTDVDTPDRTQTGALLGTPGYMAPEQVRGAPATSATDVYALGAILFEILTHVPLHPRGHAGLASALSTPQELPSRRAPDEPIPPELDVLCFSALAELPEKRPTARDLATKVQAFLDGDRDLARRRDLAREQLEGARAALAANDPDSRATAMRRAGRALVLDPTSTEAADIVSSLLLEAPSRLPSELEAKLAEHEREMSKARAKSGVLNYLAVMALAPVLFVLDVKSWPMVAAFYGSILLGLLVALDARRTGRPSIPAILVVNLGIVVLFTRVGGPFMLTPLVICAVLVSITAIPALAARRWLVVAWTVTAVLLPIGFELAGILPRTWGIEREMMWIQSTIFRSSGAPEMIALITANLLLTIVVGLFALAVSRNRQEVQRSLYIQAWHLEQLLPRKHDGWKTRAGGR